MRTVLASLISAAALVAFAPQANALPSQCDASPGNIVLNCGFELPAVGGLPPDWTFTPASAGSDARVTGASVHSGTQIFEFGAVDNINDTLSQVLFTNAGAHYTFDFFYDPSGGNPSDLIVKWDNQTLLTFTNEPFQGGYVEYSFEVIGTGTDTISFAAYDEPNFDLLDDVSVIAHTVEGVPEPMTMSLFGAGVAGAAALRRRRKTKA